MPSDSRTVRTGLRQVRMKRLHRHRERRAAVPEGQQPGPHPHGPGRGTPEELERDVVLAREAGLDLLRVHAHITRPELYDAADRHGMLLWQDLPLQWGYAHSVRKQAVRQAASRRRPARPPPVGGGLVRPQRAAGPRPPSPGIRASGRTRWRSPRRQELPTWNKTVLDRSVGRALEQRRPVPGRWSPTRASGPTRCSGGTDIHLYFGWYQGDERDLPRLLATVPAWPASSPSSAPRPCRPAPS